MKRVAAAGVAASLLVVPLTGCSGSEAEPTTPWCVRAAGLLEAGSAVATVDRDDAGAVEAAYRDAADAADSAVAGAPEDLLDDLGTVRDATVDLADALAGHGFDLEAAAGDPVVVAITDDPAVEDAAARLEAAIRGRCPETAPGT